MGDNTNSFLNPFLFNNTRKFEMTKTRNRADKNPFLLDKRELQELNFNSTIKSKPRPKHYLNLNEDYFENDIMDKKMEKAPFTKGKQNFNALFKGFEDNKEIKKEANNLIIRPNINIFICVPNNLNNIPINQNHDIIQSHQKREKSKKVINPFIRNQEETEEDRLFNLIVDLNEKTGNPAPVQPGDPISDVTDMLDKMDINSKEGGFQKKENDEKIYTNDNMETPGRYYME